MNATKLIAVGAIALTSAAFAEIASDIVGYKQQGLRAGTMLYTPCFVDVGGEGVDLTNIIPGGDYKAGEIVVSLLDGAGRNIEDYLWTKDRSGNWFWQIRGGSKVAAGDVVFGSGCGVSVTGDDDLSLTSAGAVSKNDVTVLLRNGTTPCGNSTAVVLDLTSIIVQNAKAGEVMISILDAAGRNVEDYIWSKDRSGNWFWQIRGGSKVAKGDVTFQPGQGFLVTGVDGSSIVIPGPDFN